MPSPNTIHTHLKACSIVRESPLCPPLQGLLQEYFQLTVSIEVGHCAFRNPDARPDSPPRRSVQARFTVIEPAPYEKPTTLADPRPPETLKQPWREFVHLPEKPLMWEPNFAREDMQMLEVV